MSIIITFETLKLIASELNAVGGDVRAAHCRLQTGTERGVSECYECDVWAFVVALFVAQN